MKIYQIVQSVFMLLVGVLGVDYSTLIIPRAQYLGHCTTENYRCMMGMTACYSMGFLRQFTIGSCELPTVNQCVDYTQQNCFSQAACVLEELFVPFSSTNSTCVIPQDSDNNNCTNDCDYTTNPVCALLSYYSENNVCTKLTAPGTTACLGLPLCGDTMLDSICKQYGYINDINTSLCKLISPQDCISNLYPNHCNGPNTYCQKKYGFYYDSATSTCSFNCLLNYNCQTGTGTSSFCLRDQTDTTFQNLGPFGFDQLNSQGRCTVTLSIQNCINYTAFCPLACIAKYNLISTSDGCSLPSHSACDFATQQSVYGCSSDKYVCKTLGWSQITKGSNVCADPTNTCISQLSICVQKDHNGIQLGSYLGLILDSKFGWSTPTSITDCSKTPGLCSRAQSYCRKLGFLLSGTNSCLQPDILANCKGFERCQTQYITACEQLYGFVSASTTSSVCAVPTNCTSQKKLTATYHACELNGFISLDSNNLNFFDSLDIFSNLNMNLDLNYNIIYNYCILQITMKNPFCSNSKSVCNQIGFSANTDGTCAFPLIETCLVAGSGSCSSNNICLRIYKLQQASGSSDCVVPYSGDYTKCSTIQDVPTNQYLYCQTYFGYKFRDLITYCSTAPGKTTAYCTGTLATLCDVLKAGCTPTLSSKYQAFNTYTKIGALVSGGLKTNPFYTVITACIGQTTCTSSCTVLGFTVINGICSIPTNCAPSDVSYVHACHITRQINPNLIATQCIGAASCSSLCLFYGFIAGGSGQCTIPDAATCTTYSSQMDTYYHACAYQNYGAVNMDISQYCLQTGKNRCTDQTSLCVKYYNFQKSASSNDCLLLTQSQLSQCNLAVGPFPIICQALFSYLLTPVVQILIPMISASSLPQQASPYQGLAAQLGYIVTSTLVVEPKISDCLRLKLCTTPTRFGASNPYQTFCMDMGFTGNTDGSCYVDVMNCVTASATSECSEACKFSGFADNLVGEPCLILEVDKFYCDKTFTENPNPQAALCTSLGYKWVTDHFELPTHSECEDNDHNNYCQTGATTCTSRGWTSVNGNCEYLIDCLEKTNNYCQVSSSICFYLGYAQVDYRDANDDYYDCQVPVNLNCLQTGQNNCASSSYSICVQQGYTQIPNTTDCKCNGIVYQGVCFLITNNSSSSPSSTTHQTHLQFNPFNPSLLFFILLVFLFLRI